MTYFAPPVELHGNADQQISDIYTYLFKLAAQLNLSFEQTTPAAIFEEVNKALEHADSGKETDKAIVDNYQQLKSLVIKTADYTSGYGSGNVETYSGYFVAKSEFGEYKEQTNATITQTSTDLTQMYEYAASLGILGNGESDVDITDIETWTQAYIKSGLLYYDGALPKFGVAVGDVKQLVTIDGHEVINRQNLLATFTADRLSFWQSGSEVAYLSSGSMYFPSAHISGGSIEIGGSESGGQHVTGPFYVDSEGNLVASSATISGTLTAQSGSQLGNWSVNTAIYNGKTSLSDTSHSGIYMGTDGLYLGDAASSETYVKLLPNGTLTANSATITGELHAGSGSTICDWTIGKTTGTNPVSYIYSGSRTTIDSTAAGIYIGTDGISAGTPLASSGDGFKMSASGAITCRGATIRGSLTATSLTITSNATVSGLSADFITTGSLSADLITSGTMSANRIYGGTINGNTVSVTNINASNITSGSLSADRVSTGTLTSTTGNINVNGYLTIKNGTSTAGTLGYISTGQGNSGVGMVAGNYGGWVCAFTNGVKIGYYDGTQVAALSNQLYFKLGTGKDMYLYSGALYPGSSGGLNLGTSSAKWGDTYCTNSAWTGSDRNEKTDISYNIDDYLDVFDRLQPVSYKRIDGQSGRTHIGFIAQDVEQAILDSGMTTQEYACVAKYEKENDGGYGYALRYEEFIALAILKIKKLEARIAALGG